MERSYNIRNTAICRRCLGEGIIITEGVHLGHGRYSEPTELVCDLCNGTGMVQVNKEIKVSITPKHPTKPYAKE